MGNGEIDLGFIEWFGEQIARINVNLGGFSLDCNLTKEQIEETIDEEINEHGEETPLLQKGFRI